MACQQPSATNLLANPGFDGSLSPWGGYGAIFSTVGYGDCPGSGAADMDSGNGSNLFECLPATAGVMYSMSFRFKGTETTQNNIASCRVDFYPSANVGCWDDPALSTSLGASLGTPLSAEVTSTGATWSTSAGVGGLAPAGTARVSFTCKATQGRGLLDQLYFGTATAPTF